MPRHPNYGRNPKCSIKGCNYAVVRGYLCKRHHAMVPLTMRITATGDCFLAEMAEAQRHHRKWLAFVRKQLREGVTV